MTNKEGDSHGSAFQCLHSARGGRAPDEFVRRHKGERAKHRGRDGLIYLGRTGRASERLRDSFVQSRALKWPLVSYK